MGYAVTSLPIWGRRTASKAGWDGAFGSGVTILQEAVGYLGTRPGHLTRTLKSKDEEIQNKTIVPEDEGRKLQASNQTISVHVRHAYESIDEYFTTTQFEDRFSTLVRQDRVVLRSDVVGQVVVQDET